MSKYAERLYGQFQKEKESFHRWLLGALLLSVFYGFVFQPYLALLTDLAILEIKQIETDKKLKNIEKEVKIASGAIERAIRFMGDASEYQRLYEDANTWIDSTDEIEQRYDLQSRIVASLRDSLNSADQEKWPVGQVPNEKIIRLLKSTRPEMMNNYHLRDNCFFRIEDDWVACRVSQKRKPISDRLSRVLYDRTLAHEHTALLKKDILSNDKKYRSSLSGALSQGSLKLWVKEYLEAEQAIIRRWYEDVALNRSELIGKSKSHQDALKEHKLAEAILDQRKKNFSQTGELKTPIGPVKLALHDILASVPFLGLFILSMLVKSTSRLIIIRSTFQVNGPEDETTREALSLTMPIWLEPYNHRGINALLLVGTALLAIATLFGLWQVITNPGLEVAGVSLNIYFIVLLTTVIALVFTIFYVQLVARYLSIKK